MRAALFDLDDTLLDRAGSLRDFATWQAEGMLSASIKNKHNFVDRFITLDQNGMVWKDQVYTSLIDEFELVDWTVDELLTVYILTFCAFCKPRKGALPAIEEFRRNGFRIGLVTNGKTPFQERNFKALGFSELFDCVVVSEAVGLRKPDKAIFELACQKLDVDAGSSVFIGDNPVADIQGAKSAGMATIYVPVIPDYSPCTHADNTYENLSDLLGYADREVKRIGR